MSSKSKPSRPRFLRFLAWGAGLTLAGAVLAATTLAIALALLAPQLPDVSSLQHYQPHQPLRVYTADGKLIGEFGQERREFVRIQEIPKVMQQAVVAVEDARFYEHGGLDGIGLLRAVYENLRHGRVTQGASTITQQVAKNVFLNGDRTLRRKLSEALLAWRLERELTKDQILEIYMNQIYLGQRSWGFAAASQAYFGKPLQQIDLAEAAMLAGLPKAPTANNPMVNPRRARARQLYVLERMQATGAITADQAIAAFAQDLHLRDPDAPEALHADYVAEAVRQQMLAQYGEAATTRGLKVTTTLVASEQAAAVRAVREGLLDFARRQAWRGPEKTVTLPDAAADKDAVDDAVEAALADLPDGGDVPAAVVLQASAHELTLMRANGDTLSVKGDGLRLVRAALGERAPAGLRVQRGAVLRVMQDARDAWQVVQLPEAQAALVALDPRDGDIRALVGGFDFARSKFNRAMQAWRQPGSAFKPFVYSAALEQGFTPASVVDDAPLSFDAAGGASWQPKNYDGRYAGPMTLRHALEESKNMVTLRLLQAVGIQDAREWSARFGFDIDKQPANLPLGLGAGSVTPLQMAAAYGVFANGGLRVTPRLITRVTEADGRVLYQAPAEVPERAISARNAFVMDNMLASVIKSGTGARAYQALKRNDLHGKTGTTNDAVDTWFAGYQPTRVAVAWVGYDTPRPLGARGGETGASLALPIWTAYMREALRGVPQAPSPAPPTDVVQVDGDWHYAPYEPQREVARLKDNGSRVNADQAQALAAANDPSTGGRTVPPEEQFMPAPTPVSGRERNWILDMFR